MQKEGRKNVNQTHSDPNGGGLIHGDESHDLQSAKQHQHKLIQVYSIMIDMIVEMINYSSLLLMEKNPAPVEVGCLSHYLQG